MDLKALKLALDQLEEERHLPREKIIGAIEDALAAAYKKEFGKRNQIIRATFDPDTGATEFSQVKIVTDETMIKPETESEEAAAEVSADGDVDERVRFNEDHHIMLDDARKIKRDAAPSDEIIFPLEAKEDYGRIAAQTAKQVIIQRIREAEKYSVLGEYEDKAGTIITGKVQKIERGNVFVDLGRATAFLPREEQIPGEFYRQGERIRAYLVSVEETPRGINLRLSRAHPEFVEKLFAQEAPEIASGVVEVKCIAREPGSRTKIAVMSHQPNIDPVGSCVGQRGSRVSTIISELGGEKIDIIEWEENPETFIGNALSPAQVNKVILDEESKTARIEVNADQFSLAVGKGGQNARLANKLTGWKIDIIPPEGMNEPAEKVVADFVDLDEGKVDDGTEEIKVEETPKEPVEE